MDMLSFKSVMEHFLDNLGPILGDTIEFEFKNYYDRKLKFKINKTKNDRFLVSLNSVEDSGYSFEKEMSKKAVMEKNMLLEKDGIRLIGEEERERIRREFLQKLYSKTLIDEEKDSLIEKIKKMTLAGDVAIFHREYYHECYSSLYYIQLADDKKYIVKSVITMIHAIAPYKLNMDNFGEGANVKYKEEQIKKKDCEEAVGRYYYLDCLSRPVIGVTTMKVKEDCLFSFIESNLQDDSIYKSESWQLKRGNAEITDIGCMKGTGLSENDRLVCKVASTINSSKIKNAIRFLESCIENDLRVGTKEEKYDVVYVAIEKSFVKNNLVIERKILMVQKQEHRELAYGFEELLFCTIYNLETGEVQHGGVSCSPKRDKIRAYYNLEKSEVKLDSTWEEWTAWKLEFWNRHNKDVEDSIKFFKRYNEKENAIIDRILELDKVYYNYSNFYKEYMGDIVEHMRKDSSDDSIRRELDRMQDDEKIKDFIEKVKKQNKEFYDSLSKERVKKELLKEMIYLGLLYESLENTVFKETEVTQLLLGLSKETDYKSEWMRLCEKIDAIESTDYENYYQNIDNSDFFWEDEDTSEDDSEDGIEW